MYDVQVYDCVSNELVDRFEADFYTVQDTEASYQDSGFYVVSVQL